MHPPQANLQSSVPLRILVLDDDPMVGKSLGRILKMHHVVVTSHVDHALEILGETDFHLIFCDLMMPNRNGMDFFDEVQTRHPTCTDNIVFMTGGAFTTKAESFMRGIRNPCLAKPFEIEHVREFVRTFQVGA